MVKVKVLKKIIVLFVFLTQGVLQSFSNDNFEITLLTCSSGKETFSAWGHTALRVVDKAAGIDVVYNFGLFDFNTPNFYGKFVKGRLKYKLGIQPTHHFYQDYYEENRQIIEQKLNISEEEKIKIINQLIYLYKPENRYYLYRFAGKNCTTEIRNILLNNVNSDYQNKQTDKTIRLQLNEFLQGRKWLKFSMSLIMGYKIDKEIDLNQSMFLPDYLCREIRNINVRSESIIEEETIYNQVVDPYKTNYPTLANPIFTFLLLLVIVLFLKSKAIQNIVLTITGLTGLVILLISLITEHPELQYNLNILWINPLYFILAFRLTKRANLKKYIAYISQFLILVMIPIWVFKVQYFELTYLPIIFLLSLINFRKIKTKYQLFG